MSGWSRILDEYVESRDAIRNYEKNLKWTADCNSDVESEIIKDMYSEINENIGKVRKNYYNELSRFLLESESSILTERQHAVMTMRARGMSMEEIAKSLNVSRTAVFKSIKLSEKKIKKMLV